MNTLALKLLITPALMAGVTLAVRRWGPSVGGWLVGLPLSSGPISLFLWLERGPAFAARAAVSTLLGIVAVAATVLTYAIAAQRWSWPATTMASLAVFVVVAAGVGVLDVHAVTAFAIAFASLVVAITLLPSTAAARSPIAPAWDVPVRIGVALAMVLGITAAAGRLGPNMSGLLSPFPVFTIVTAVFEHRGSGGVTAAPYARGLLASLIGFALFFLTIALTLEQLGGRAFALATAASLTGSVAAGVVTRRLTRGTVRASRQRAVR
jgi:hypothetical protein